MPVGVQLPIDCRIMKFTHKQKIEITRTINKSKKLSDEVKKIVLQEIKKAYFEKKCKKCNRTTLKLIKGRCRVCYDVYYKKTRVYRDDDFTVYIDPISEEYKPFEIK